MQQRKQIPVYVPFSVEVTLIEIISKEIKHLNKQKNKTPPKEKNIKGNFYNK